MPPYTPGISHEYQKKGVAKFAICNRMKTKEGARKGRCKESDQGWWVAEMQRQRTKGGAPFSAAIRDKNKIAQEVLAVNVYLVGNSNDCGRC